MGSQSPPLKTFREMLAVHGEALGGVCRQQGVERLLVFGTALSDDDPVDGSTGVDFSVVFGFDAVENPVVRTLDLKSALESLFGVPVDLTELRADANARQSRILQSSQVVVYERLASA